ncbi:RNA polymerase sigma factor [Pedobacter sp. BS3]|uniref:RNA polymerase sigma factor n=1 Tax=Pedobacter sp. BS3 TaxID=2567937 RepID=UPI001F5BF822|nr:sigma-70 family RNA polymerase sigma factor [Pedobacter sp. BS3]
MNFIKDKHSDHINEHHLLEEYRKSGNLKTLGQLYQLYMPLVYGLCLKYLKDEELSKDAVMQIFEELVKKLRVHQVINFKSWLYTLARNYCLMQLRSSGRHEHVSIDNEFMEFQDDSHLDISAMRERQLTMMENCLETLPEEQRKSIRLFYLEQKCYQEISGLTGYDMNKVKSYIQNGKRNLKICMEKKGGNE